MGTETTTQDPRVTRSKEAVVAATVALLAERGVGATSIEAIADRSGVAKTTIYRHWPGKAELVIDAFESLMDEPHDPDTGSFETDLVALAVGLSHALDSGPWSELLPSLVDAAERDPDLAVLHGRLVEGRHAAVRAVVSRARSRGEVRNDVVDLDIIELVAGPLFYRRMMGRDPLDRDRAERIARLVAAAVAPG